jgi:hypothetical protein
MQTVSGFSAAVALASVGTALTSPARLASFKNSRRLQDLSASNIAYLNAQRYYRRTGQHLNENASIRYV